MSLKSRLFLILSVVIRERKEKRKKKKKMNTMMKNRMKTKMVIGFMK